MRENVFLTNVEVDGWTNGSKVMYYQRKDNSYCIQMAFIDLIEYKAIFYHNCYFSVDKLLYCLAQKISLKESEPSM